MEIPKSLQYFIELHGTRDGWPDNMTAAEAKIMNEHYEYLKELTIKRKVLMAGQVFSKFEMIVLAVYSETEATKIMDEEPSVVKGVHTYTITPMTVSLMAQSMPPYQYAEEPSGKELRKEVIVNASLDDIWQAWTTTKGINTFFSPSARVELRQGGPFEIYFLDENPYGLKGSEDCKILAYLPKKMLSFEWNGPAQFGILRYKKTQVNLFFEEITPGKVKVEFIQHGWGTGEDWDKLYTYFDKAWDWVLSSLVKRFNEGPLDWSK